MKCIAAFLLFSSAAFGDALTQQQWHLKNDGRAHPVILNEVKTKWIQGRTGEDIGLQGAPQQQKRVRIAVLDTGLDVTHPDFKDLVRRKPSECALWEEFKKCRTKDTVAKCKPLLKTDADGNGYPGDCAGWDATAGVPLINDEAGHGTHVAGLIAAQRNAVGVEGVLQNVDLIPIRVLGAKEAPTVGKAVDRTGTAVFAGEAGLLTMENVAKGVLYAIKENADVINMSLGWPSLIDSKNVRDLVALAQSKGILVVAAAGNDSTDAVIFPCAYPGVICVGASDPAGKIATFSNFGFSVDVTAPGVNVLSDWPLLFTPAIYTEGKGYEIKNGTSMAAPLVSAVLGRLLSTGFSPEAARAKLLAGTRPLNSADDGASSAKYVNFGQVDLARAIAAPPVPIVVPYRRDSLRVGWAPAMKEIEFPVILQNIGVDARNVRLSLRIVRRDDPSENLEGFSIGQGATAEMPEWESGGAMKVDLKVALTVPPNRLESEGLVEVTVLGKRVLVPFELIRRLQASEFPERRPIVTGGCPVKPDDLQTVEGRDGSATVDYVALSPQTEDGSIRLSLLHPETRSSGTHVIQKFCVKVAPGEFPSTAPLAIHRLNWDLAGESEYALVFPKMDGEKTFMELHIFNTQGARVAKLRHDQVRGPMVAQFQWAPITGRLSPVWNAVGDPAVKAPFDPWDPKKKPEKKLRLFFLTEEGLGEIDTPEKTPLMLIPQTMEDFALLRVRILLGQGAQFEKSYFVAEIAGPALSGEVALTLEQNRQLFNQPMAPLLGGKSAGESVAAQVSLSHGVRLMRLRSSGIEETSTELDDEADPIRRVLGVFADGRSSDRLAGFFGQSRYRLVFTDVRSGERVQTDLRRFSFLSPFQFDRLFLPLTVQSAEGELPAAFVPEGVGTSLSSELIVPSKAAGGSRLHLVRPAQWRLRAPEGCRSLNPVRDSEARMSFVYVCFSEMLILPVSH